MENSSRFFSNKECKYYPCHTGVEEFNCLFCYCPLNSLKHCPGNPEFVKCKDGKIIKDCTNCDFPHRPENYDVIIKFLTKNMPAFEEE